MTVTLRVEATATAGGLVLRPWRADDAEAVIEAYRDPDIARWTTSPMETPEDALRWLERQWEDAETGKRLSFAVCEPQLDGEYGKLLCNISLKWNDDSREIGEVGYWTLAHARGQGVAPRALEALSTWAFDAFAGDGLRRLELLHQIDNLASCRVAEKTGYRLDRILPAYPPYPRDGHVHVRDAD
ncbi:GNAT family N-acetyltransferase [Streptomyces sp. HUAS TT7]|uniref:GNAT family N-acetyltransferase n=1 Tax=Streptomyces sp. HUAS TT7 TaxID=3447507 RepID=UPI003F660A63